jgi:aryl-alcohol dehydrogenase-like predicted oxidoreductase
MEYVTLPGLEQKICRVGVGTWAIGGWLWGGTNEKESIETLHHAFELGINLIDTAPAYGFGISEEIVGKALKQFPGNKDNLVIASKAGLDWREGTVFRDSRKIRIFQEVEDSLKRLGVDAIDLYQVHWPDFETPLEETAQAMHQLLQSGKIRAIGVSNYTPEMIDEFKKGAPVHVLQSPFNLFEKAIESAEIPYCKKNHIILLGYGSLCRGLLSGRMSKKTTFKGDDIRQLDPKFRDPYFSRYLVCVEKLGDWAAGKHNHTLLELALRWTLDKGIDISLVGVRRPEQLNFFNKIWDWKLTSQDMEEIDGIILDTVKEPLGVEFMAPKGRKDVLQKA